MSDIPTLTNAVAKYRRLPDPSLPWPITRAGVYLLCEQEDCVLTTYLDYPGRTPTIGWGETDGIVMGMVWTEQQADLRLLDELKKYTDAVRKMCTVPPSNNQLSALVVCAYNIGLAGMRGSSMMRLHNAGQFIAAAQAFHLWNKAHTPEGELIEVAGLSSRRALESSMYLTPDVGSPTLPSPQVVAPEPKMIASPTVLTGSAAVLTGGVSFATTLLDILHPLADQVKELAADVGLSPMRAFSLVLVLVGVLVLYRRWRQRNKGVA